MNKTAQFLPELIIIIAWLAVFFKIVPVGAVTILALSMMFFRLGIAGIVYISLMHMVVFWGYFRAIIANPIPGLTWVILAAILIALQVARKKLKMPYWGKGLSWVLAIIVFFLISSLTTTGGDYAQTKLLNALLYAVTSYIAFTILFVGTNNLERVKISLYLIIFGILLLRIGSEMSGQMPSGFFDFGFMRSAHNYFDDEELQVSFHHPPFLALHGFALLFISRYENHKKAPFFEIILLLMCMLISLYAGARQFIVTAIAFVFLWGFLSFSKGKYFFRMLIILVITFVLTWVFGLVFGEEGILRSTVDEGYIEGAGRGPWLLQGIDYFISHPLTGIGFGRFSFLGKYGQYPHNMIIELLCETGIIGFLIYMGIIIYHIKQSRDYFLSYIFLLLVFFMRSMASGGLDTNIAVLTLSVSTCSLISCKKYPKLKLSQSVVLYILAKNPQKSSSFGHKYGKIWHKFLQSLSNRRFLS